MRPSTTITLVLTSAVGLALLTACGDDDPGGSRDTGGPSTGDQVALAMPFDRLSVTTDGSVRVEAAAPGTSPTARRTVHGSDGATPAGAVRTEGSTLVLDGRCGDDCSTDYVVTVPRGTPVRVATTGGAVSTSDTGAADLSTDAGTVDADRVAGDATARSQAGAVTLRGIAGSADASSQAGPVSVGATRPADVSARSEAADVTITVPPGPYRVDARDIMGTAGTAVPSDPSAPHTLTARTSAGHVHVRTG